MFRRIVAGWEAFILEVERVGTFFSSKDAISCHVKASRIEVRNSQNGICMLPSVYEEIPAFPYRFLNLPLKGGENSEISGVTTVNSGLLTNDSLEYHLTYL